jgi:AcrR family transcriptional regulator
MRIVSKQPAGPRQIRRNDVTARILQIGRAHLAQHGAAALSLRAVARELGLVSSAVYRYVANRDELLTLLIVDAYTELADAVDDAVLNRSDQPWSERILIAARGIRAWAVREPARYALLYGSPVPGYAAPAEQTTEPGTRVILALVGLVREGVSGGDIVNGEGPVPLPPTLRSDLATVAVALGADVDPAVLARAVMLWSVIFGAISLEMFGQYGPDTFADPGLLFEHQVAEAVTAVRARSGV